MAMDHLPTAPNKARATSPWLTATTIMECANPLAKEDSPDAPSHPLRSVAPDMALKLEQTTLAG